MDGVEDYAKRLSRLHKSAIPTVVRNTLNAAAFDVKKNTLPEQSQKAFINRSKNFFKAFSVVDKADGWNIESMQATIGMTSEGLSGKNNYAVEDLEQQEHGGKITNKAFIPMKTARSGRNDEKTVVNYNRMDTFDQLKFTGMSSRIRGKNTKKQMFIRAAIYAKMKGDSHVLGNTTKKGGRTLWRIDSVSTNVRSRRLKIKSTPIYNVKGGRSFKVEGKGFMEKAATDSAKIMPEVFKKEAERQFKKFLG
jgi:hypothetical protein